ncbi:MULTISPECIES: hypothetical protein [Empedobacter]|uniref:Uncharacterized protein n=1 Tax=Empedobacter falsenii TaxID=343874 RepID=A0A3R8SLK3_9FLAO|nr:MULTISPECIES: hypothetical protein [Empedobacter]MDH0675436.1 hypothetical protein [Empedobacter sp. GD03861]MDH1603735.1 hypothetical protein [Empedobacter sp. GD03739]RRT91331.1 hypothetical protein EGI89_08845 [Empedobacter falsenii]RRT91390.1 hypothetical protein EGI88_08775 [Empedobacter falsenii]
MIENYIQLLEGYNKDNITFSDIEKAIIEINESDDEHGIFWVSIISDDDFENVIETSKSLDLIITFNEISTKYKAKDWNEVKELYKLLLEEKFDIIKTKIK